MPGRKKEWNEYDLVLQSLYGICLANMELSKPVFGTSIRFPLSTSHSKNDIQLEKQGWKVIIKGKNEEMLKPTFLNLAYHLGLLDWAERNINLLVREYKVEEHSIDKRFMKSVRSTMAHQFHERYVLPLRKELKKYGLYLYCLPSITLGLDEKTGNPLVSEGDEVLCLLPMTAEWAKKYGLSDDDIMALAPQVLWLIKNLCGQKIITTKYDLDEALDGWGRYVSLPVNLQIRGLIEEKRQDLANEA